LASKIKKDNLCVSQSRDDSAVGILLTRKVRAVSANVRVAKIDALR